MLSDEKVKKSLCAYDKRNPDNIPGPHIAPRECVCSNCFYDKTEIALKILAAREGRVTISAEVLEKLEGDLEFKINPLTTKKPRP